MIWLCIYVILVVVQLVLHSAWPIGHRLVRAANGTFFLLDSDQTILTIPNKQSAVLLAKFLNVDISRLPRLSKIEEHKVNALYAPSQRLMPNLHATSDSADEAMRVLAQAAELLDTPKSYWKRTIPLGNYLNPSIVRWHDRTLMLYRVDINATQQLIQMVWLTDNFRVDARADYLGIKSGYVLDHSNLRYEDPRGLLLSNGSLLITYGIVGFRTGVMCHTIATVGDDGKAHFSDMTKLGYEKKYRQGIEKNWIPFEYNRRVYFYTHFNPYIVATHADDLNALRDELAAPPIIAPVLGASNTIIHNEVNSESSNAMNSKGIQSTAMTSANSTLIAGLDQHTLSVVFGVSEKLDQKEIAHHMRLPWINLFGAALRGGTPAIRVPISDSIRREGEIAALGPETEVLLSVFHTKHKGVWAPAPQVHTYFMGFLATCARPPFNVVMSSKVAIMDYARFYAGPWVNAHHDYIVFPVGIMLRENKHDVAGGAGAGGENASEVDYSVWVSMGYQDKEGYAMKFDLNGLLSSLHFHSKCSPDASIVESVMHFDG